MMQYIYDFLSILFDKLKERDKIRNIILFGSFARGDQRKNSDVDLFIDVTVDNRKEVERLLKEAIGEFEIKISNSWKLKGIHNPIVPIIDDINLKKWDALRREINSYGILLYGKYNTPVTGGKKILLIEYDLSTSKQKDKMRIMRKLFGYRLKKGKKIYRQRGLIEKFNAEKISHSLLIDATNYKEIYNVFKKEGIYTKIRDLALVE